MKNPNNAPSAIATYAAMNATVPLQQPVKEASHKTAQQRRILRAILTAKENERRHIGAELHDNINQLLSGTKLYLSIACKTKPELKQVLDYPVKLIEDTMQEIRMLTHKSVTPVQNINLKELLEKLCHTMFAGTNIACNLMYAEDELLYDDELKLNVYRIIQEQSNNILKYADAENVSVAVCIQYQVIRFVIKDDGRGFDTSKKSNGIGFNNIKNRVTAFDGDMQLESSPGNGCSLCITIPF
ncbi:MAG: hypothetical protein JST86_16595 [Bacteroidetes bacterium]|nr:hypothetical protein [Bacteroidota bacterium]